MQPLGTLKYLYVGSARFDEDLAYFRDQVGAQVVWNFAKFGARVAALRVAAGPLLLLADHRPAPSCMPIFAVDDLPGTVAALRARGWSPRSGPFEIPEGPCYVFSDPSGNPYALFGNVRPGALEEAFADEQNEGAVREQ